MNYLKTLLLIILSGCSTNNTTATHISDAATITNTALTYPGIPYLIQLEYITIKAGSLLNSLYSDESTGVNKY